jgi:putative phage-type endonuclease
MKKKLELIPTQGMTRDAWLSWRHNGLGASEVGAVLGLDDYTSSLELYYYKIGEVPKFDTESLMSFLGREQEDLVARIWSYWDGDEAGMIRNFRAGNMVRKCQRVNAFVRNPDIPWLYVSLDRKINRTETAGEGTLELKTIGGFEADKWESGLPPKYITQVQTQMAVCEFDHGEMAILQDGRKFHVLPFTRSEAIVAKILDTTRDFWDRVERGRKLVTEKYHAMINYNQKRVDQLTHEIDALAPEPDGTLVYANYLAQRHQRPATATRKGTELELEDATQQRKLADTLTELTEKKLLYENRLKKAMGDQVEVLDFEDAGRVYWAKSKSGSRIFRNKLKM